MGRLLSVAEVRELDRLTVEKYHVPIAVLMENAGKAVADAALPRCASGRAFVYAGAGDNGGDGLVAARYLRERGLEVSIWLAAEPERLGGEAKANFERCQALGIPLLQADPPALGRGDVAIDALLGIGLTRPAEGRFEAGINALNEGKRAGARIIAVDLPSGLDAESGRPLGPCVNATVTVTMGAAKRGLSQEPGAGLAGELVVADIGIPKEALAEFPALLELLDEPSIHQLFQPRARDSHKGTYGHLLVVAGSQGKQGAAALCVKAASRAGSGLVTLASRSSAAEALWTVAPEAMSFHLPGEGALKAEDVGALRFVATGKAAMAIGPGIPRGPGTADALAELLADFQGPTVLDADALNAFAEQPSLLKRAGGPLVLTPHPGEMGRLCGKSTADVQADRIGTAREFALRRAVIVVLKGARTVVANPSGHAWVVPTGNPGMATGGSGDVLCGLIGGLLAQGMLPGLAARAGAYIHGLAGDLAVRRRGERGLIASDLIDGISQVWSAWKL